MLAFVAMGQASADLTSISLQLAECLLDRFPDAPFFVKDANLKYVAANSAMVRLCAARSRDDLIGKSAADFFPPALAKRYEELDRQVLKSGKPVKDRLELSLSVDGRPEWLLYTRWPVLVDLSVKGVAASARALDKPDGRHPRFEALATVLEHMQRHFSTPLQVSDMARRVRVSRGQLQRDFVQVFGVSPRRYLEKVRLDHAMTLLREGELIAEVAHACGYGDQSAFTRRFHAALGITPREYRRSARR